MNLLAPLPAAAAAAPNHDDNEDFVACAFTAEGAIDFLFLSFRAVIQALTKVVAA